MDIDRFDFKAQLPILIILFAIIGWFLATGFGKSQYIYLTYIVLFSPYLIYLSLKDYYEFSAYEKLFLLFLGTSTITFNIKKFIDEF